MKNRSILHRSLIAGSLAAVALVAAALTDVVDAKPSGPEVPAEIDVPDGNKVFLVGHAVGDQIYRCTRGPAEITWTFVGPRADLYGDNGKLVATHFGGPTWQTRDGSSVVAQLVDGVTVDATAIPWLLLSTSTTSSGADGDRLSATTYIQRTATHGGLPPAATECHLGTVGRTARVPYTADYHFWKSTGG